MAGMYDDMKKAAALTYDRNKDVAPKVTASGKGTVAEKIIALAREHNIPLHEDKSLIEVLVKLDLGDTIPYELYRAVAEVLAFIYKMEKRAEILKLHK